MLTLSFFHVRSALFTLFILLMASGSLQAQRLPQTVVPSHYKLLLDPSISGQAFSGEETITVQVKQPTREIVLNSLGLEITLAEATVGGSTQTAQVSYDQPNEIVRPFQASGPAAA